MLHMPLSLCRKKMEIACIEAATCGASLSLEVIFLGDTVPFLELVVPLSVYQLALKRWRI